MASVPTKTADELTTAIRSLVDRALDTATREQVAARGREMAAAISEAAETVAGRTSEMATETWKESGPQRAEVARAAERFQRDALRWGRTTWRSQLRPALRNALRSRNAALAAAGGSVPVSKELMDEVRARLGLRRREERRWRTFVLGVIVGAIGGAIVALLTTPRAGREVRDQLATRARTAAEGAGDWVPLFQRPEDLMREVQPTGESPVADEPSSGNGAGEHAETVTQAAEGEDVASA
jgi:hypothetical protein